MKKCDPVHCTEAGIEGLMNFLAVLNQILQYLNKYKLKIAVCADLNNYFRFNSSTVNDLTGLLISCFSGNYLPTRGKS